MFSIESSGSDSMQMQYFSGQGGAKSFLPDIRLVSLVHWVPTLPQEVIILSLGASNTNLDDTIWEV